MAKQTNRYRVMERYMTYALIADGAMFVLYMLFAGLGVAFLKFLTALLTLGISCLCLAVLYRSKELLRQRSLWMSCGAGAILVCLLLSLLLNYPAPGI